MADQNPTIYPAPYQGTVLDYLKAPVDRSGAVRMHSGVLSIPSGTASATEIGLIPIKKGARVEVGGSVVNFAALDTSTNVTASIGFVYGSASTATSTPACFVSASTTPQAGGTVILDSVVTGWTLDALDDGWIAVTLGASPTTSTGNITWNIAINYDNVPTP